MPINLSKGQKVDLTKGNPGLTKIMVGLGWDVNAFDSGSAFDLDAAAFLLGASGKCPTERDFIFYGNLKHSSGAEGDNGLQVVYLDLAGQGIHLRRVDQRLGHHLPVGGDVVLLIALFFLGGGRCLSLRGLRLGWGRSAEIQAHKSYTPSK